MATSTAPMLTRGRKKGQSRTSNLQIQKGAGAAANDPSHIRREYRFALDLGTSTYSACYAQHIPGRRLTPQDIQRIYFDEEMSYQGQMEACFDSASNFYLGRAVQSARVPAEDIITGFKLLQYADYDNSRQVMRVQAQLRKAKKTQSELLEETLRFIWNQIARQFKQKKVDLSKENAVVYLPVPRLVTTTATSLLSGAAKRAGLPRIMFVSEPLCSGVAILKALCVDLSFPNAPDYQGGEQVMVVDIGGGTTDVASLQTPQSSDDLLHNKMTLVGTPSGILCGGTDIDENFREYCLQYIRARYNQPDVSQRIPELMSQVVRLFQQQHKVSFPRMMEMALPIRASSGTALIEIPLTKAIMAHLFRTPINRIKECIRDQIRIAGKPKYVILAGGLESNAHVYGELERWLYGMNVELRRSTMRYHDLPLATGALLVETEVDQSRLRSQKAVGLCHESEEYDAMVHPDVDGDHIYEDLWIPGFDVVYDRIHWMIHKGATADQFGHYTTAGPFLQVFYVELDCPYITHKFVFTTNAGTRDHDPLYDHSNKLMPGLVPQKQRMRVPSDYLRALKKSGWTTMLRIEGKSELVEHYELYCAVFLRYDDHSIGISKRLAKPKSMPRSKREKWWETAALQFHENDWEEIYDADYDIEIVEPQQKPQTSIQTSGTPSSSGFVDLMEGIGTPNMPHGLPITPASSTTSTESRRSQAGKRKASGKRKAPSSSGASKRAKNVVSSNAAAGPQAFMNRNRVDHDCDDEEVFKVDPK